MEGAEELLTPQTSVRAADCSEVSLAPACPLAQLGAELAAQAHDAYGLRSGAARNWVVTVKMQMPTIW